MRLADLDAAGQAEVIAEGACSPSELLEATIAAIEQVDALINAAVIPLCSIAPGIRWHEATWATGRSGACPIVLKDLGAALAGTPQERGCSGCA